MAGEILAGLNAFSTMLGIAKTIKEMDDRVTRNAAVLDLGEQIIAAQIRYTAAVEEIGALKKELMRFETWECEKQRYELKQLNRGPLAYILKEGKEDGEDPHALCINCYQRGSKSILQSSGHVNVHDHYWFCQSCKMQTKSQWRDMSDLIEKTREAKS